VRSTGGWLAARIRRAGAVARGNGLGVSELDFEVDVRDVVPELVI
jgi:hypothetical protein